MMTPAPRLVLAANLWTLAGHPSRDREWTLERKLRAVAEAGFQAVNLPARPGLRLLLQRYNLRYTGFFSSSSSDEFARLIRAQRKAGAENINVQLGDDFTPHSVAARWVAALLREARRQGIYTAIEIHRDTALETPEKVAALVAHYRRATGEPLPLTWDHSHFAVVKHLKPFEFSGMLHANRRLVQAARLFHCRPFNGQHAQVPVFGRGGRITPEFKEWLEFVEHLFRCWLAGSRPGNELWVCPEIGPVGVHGYNLSTMPPAWAQAQVCRRKLAGLWRRLGGEISSGRDAQN
jgi:hypothetical protein